MKSEWHEIPAKNERRRESGYIGSAFGRAKPREVMMCDMENEEGTSEPDDIGPKLTAAAHHEAGHLVIAASLGLPLRPEGLSMIPWEKGLPATVSIRTKQTSHESE